MLFFDCFFPSLHFLLKCLLEFLNFGVNDLNHFLLEDLYNICIDKGADCFLHFGFVDLLDLLSVLLNLLQSKHLELCESPIPVSCMRHRCLLGLVSYEFFVILRGSLKRNVEAPELHMFGSALLHYSLLRRALARRRGFLIIIFSSSLLRMNVLYEFLELRLLVNQLLLLFLKGLLPNQILFLFLLFDKVQLLK